MKYFIMVIMTVFLIGCGGGGGGSTSSSSTNIGKFLDSPVEGLEYSSSTSSEIQKNRC